jgi:F-type H+-transporting ATPase subunit gamma
MRQIRSRIRVAKNIQQITKAMKMVAAARLKRSQDRVGAARPYAQKIRDVIGSLSRAGASTNHPLLVQRDPVRIGVLAITADRGLCGSYATNVIRRANELLRSYDPANVRMLVVGRKGHAFFRRRPYPVVGEYGINMTGVTFAEAQEIATRARELFASGEIDVLYLVYTRFLSALTQRPDAIQLLPVVTEEEAALAAAGKEGEIGGEEEYLFEPNAEAILNRLLPRYVDTLIYQALLEGVASEHGARMTAMSSATDNAGKMISSLTLSLNRARQANITKEIAEIVGGAEALK